MKRHTLPVAVALAASAALLLTACGGGDEDSKDSGNIAGAGTGDAAPSASPSTSADAAERPQVSLPADVKHVYDSWTSSDADEAAVLADAKHRIEATDAAITSGDVESKAIPFYYAGSALLGAADWIKGYTDDNYTITGTTRYYEPSLTKFDKDSVGLVYCADESKAYDKDRKTKKVDKTAVTAKSYVLYNTRMDRNAKGVWQTSKLSSERGNKKCMP
ncbi:hypothetical protein ABZT03_04980 [Streptomyces sp. NPDC005574]|uniref:hypothetical protein n=1 Tax=Streptomyces sp. NPDC005574 TaxID=3156891 RepID=UPI0033AE650A